MARITVEDCLQRVENRFELVLMATHRARKIANGAAEPLVEWENDKPTVVALREIADGEIDARTLEQMEAADRAAALAELEEEANSEDDSE